MGNVPQLALDSWNTTIPDKSSGVGDKGILYCDTNMKQFHFYRFSTASSEIRRTVNYVYRPMIWSVSDGFIYCYKSSTSDKPYEFELTKTDDMGYKQWSKTITSNTTNLLPGYICEDGLNKNIVLGLMHYGFESNIEYHVFNSNGDNIRSFTGYVSDNVVGFKHRNTFAYDNMLYGSSVTNYRYSAMNYMTGTVTGSIGMSQTSAKTVAINPKSNFGYCFENGSVITANNMIEVSNTRSIPIKIDRDDFGCKNQNPISTSPLIFSNQDGNLLEIDLNVTKSNASKASVIPNIRVMTEIYTNGSRSTQFIATSSSGKTLVQHDGGLSTSNNTIYIYRR
ncbi:hypothetical protein [Clostridium sporogenes]|uniref:hypothetical protein n=1 Tax=Clostridium sporogenes TaxID=1509 RepID=UPI0012BAC93A|nr:hypothetical protein [Clostridium sporogenes]